MLLLGGGLALYLGFDELKDNWKKEDVTVEPSIKTDETEKYEKISILFGCKSPAERLYVNELEELAGMGGNVEFLETVDRSDNGWTGNVGVITTLIPKVEFDPQNTIVVIVGPPIMYKFVLINLMDKQVPKENIYMSLERRMKCGVGKCGHCQISNIYVCQDGPVFRFSDIKDIEEAL